MASSKLYPPLLPNSVWSQWSSKQLFSNWNTTSPRNIKELETNEQTEHPMITNALFDMNEMNSLDSAKTITNDVANQDTRTIDQVNNLGNTSMNIEYSAANFTMGNSCDNPCSNPSQLDLVSKLGSYLQLANDLTSQITTQTTNVNVGFVNTGNIDHMIESNLYHQSEEKTNQKLQEHDADPIHQTSLPAVNIVHSNAIDSVEENQRTAEAENQEFVDLECTELIQRYDEGSIELTPELALEYCINTSVNGPLLRYLLSHMIHKQVFSQECLRYLSVDPALFGLLHTRFPDWKLEMCHISFYTIDALYHLQRLGYRFSLDTFIEAVNWYNNVCSVARQQFGYECPLETLSENISSSYATLLWRLFINAERPQEIELCMYNLLGLNAVDPFVAAVMWDILYNFGQQPCQAFV